jgi:hypothetical protein
MPAKLVQKLGNQRDLGLVVHHVLGVVAVTQHASCALVFDAKLG